jgi:hypothetical protein
MENNHDELKVMQDTLMQTRTKCQTWWKRFKPLWKH